MNHGTIWEGGVGWRRLGRFGWSDGVLLFRVIFTTGFLECANLL